MDRLERAAAIVGISGVKLEGSASEEGNGNGAHIARGFRLIRASDLELTKPEWIIGDTLEADSFGSIFGDSSCGKSFVAIDMSCCIAAGIPWNGHAARHGTVIYIAGEGQRGIGRRIRAWSIEHGINLAELPLYFSMAPAQMTDEKSVDMVIETIREVAATNGEPILIVLDTLARNLDGDENSPVDMGAFVRGCDRLRAEWRCVILVVHHSGHTNQDRSRGHSSFRGALDIEYRLDKDDIGTIRMVCTKSKDSVPQGSCAFELRQVPIGIVDDDGRDVFSAVLEPTEYEPKAATGKAGRGKWQEIGIERLKVLQADHRTNLEAGGLNPDTARVTRDEWRAACVEADMPRRTFYKVQDSLVAEGLVTVEHGFVCAFQCAVPLSLQTRGTNGTREEDGQGHKWHSKGTAKGTIGAQPEGSLPPESSEKTPDFPELQEEKAKINPEDIF